MIQKITMICVFICVSTIVKAQPVFDSVSYANRYTKIFTSFNYGNSIDRQLSTTEKIAGLSKVWSEAKFSFAKFDLVPKLDWDSAYPAFIPKVKASKKQPAITITC